MKLAKTEEEGKEGIQNLKAVVEEEIMVRDTWNCYTKVKPFADVMTKAAPSQ